MNLASKDYSEKRNFIRMKVDTPVNIKVVSGEEEYEGICRDLSGGGLLVELSAPLPVGTLADVSITSSHGHNPMLQAKVRVNRVESQPEASTHPCLLGMEILELITEK